MTKAQRGPVDRRARLRKDVLMYIGLIIFAAVAVLCVVAFAKTKQKQREYEEGE
jgi:hypothetical protein